MAKKHQVGNAFNEAFNYLHNHITSLNQSKIFAGVIIIVLNISSKFVTFKLSKSMEAYLKYTFSRNILVFAMAWMGTRDIYIAAFMTLIFILCMNYLFNEDSPYSILPEQFTDYHSTLADTQDEVTDQQIVEARIVLEKAERQQKQQAEKKMLNKKIEKIENRISNNPEDKKEDELDLKPYY
jgi:hypothetical protein